MKISLTGTNRFSREQHCHTLDALNARCCKRAKKQMTQRHAIAATDSAQFRPEAQSTVWS